MVKKIAVLRANALGDFIFVLPALQALRETFPAAEIVLLGREWHKEYMEERPGPVDRVVVVPLYPGISAVDGYVPDEDVLKPFFDEMQQEDFDLAFQLHGGGRNSNPFLLRLGARQTVGLRTPDAARLDINVPYIYYFNETLRYLEVVAKVGAQTKNLEPRIAVTESDRVEAHKVLNNVDEKPVAVIHPGASDVRRRWPGNNFAEICDYLVEQGFHVCITGLEWEREIINEVIGHLRYKDQVQDLSAKLSLGGITGLLSIAGILISNDTGPLHLARALKIATIGIFWCGNGITAAPTSITLNRDLLSWRLECPLCGLSTLKFNEVSNGCDHLTSLVAEVTAKELKATIQEVLQAKREMEPLERPIRIN